MDTATWIIFIVIAYVLGHVHQHLLRRPREIEKSDEILIEHRRPNMSNPLKPQKSNYEKYRSRDSGLFMPSKPKGANNSEEMEIYK